VVTDHTEFMVLALLLDDVYRASLLEVVSKTCGPVKVLHVCSPLLCPRDVL
jgi:hypothetical protein